MAQPSSPARPSRLVVSSFSPTVRSGSFAAKRVAGDRVPIRVVVLCDGPMEVIVRVRHEEPDGTTTSHLLERLDGPVFGGAADLLPLGEHRFTVEACIDHVATLRSRVDRKKAADIDVSLDLAELAALTPARRLTDHVTSGPYRVTVDRPVAANGAWYEFFPRSTAVHSGGSGHTGEAHHGTLAEAADRLPYIAALGFDVVYLPPIHPIGEAHRKGANNSTTPGPDDPGSPWAIGARTGGHTAVHPQLGTDDDVAALVRTARALGMEVALDLALQCSPDHPWIEEHPEWFHMRPDGSIAYAENPPKRYQDIVPLAFDNDSWRELWAELADVVRHWVRLGIRVFRVDNPHTKPLAFWEWAISELKAEDPGLVFLAEAFTHPELMLHLSRLGFSQSYTHFPWQHAPWQIEQYYRQMLGGDEAQHFRGAAWPNTPDILTPELQQGLRQVFVARLVLAATLNAAYGVYGPPFELLVNEAVPGTEEYLNSEKYQLRSWDLDDPVSIASVIRRVNHIRRTHTALHHDRSLRFHRSDNDRLVVYSKTAEATHGPCDLPIVAVVTTDHWNPQDGYVHLDLQELGLAGAAVIEAHDLLSDARYLWTGGSNYVRLDPWERPAHIFELQAIEGGAEAGR